jgi:ATP-binding cassette subfamily B protein
MDSSIYAYLFRTYAHSAPLWVAVASELFRSLIMRVIVVIIMAQSVGAVAAGDFDRAQNLVVWFLVANIVAGIVGSAGEIVAVRAENRLYSKQMAAYYQKLIHKDMAFFRDSHTGYLTTMWRQHIDSSLLLVRFFRGDALRTIISLTAPAVVLLYQEWRVGLVAVLVVVSQVIYMRWASSKAKQYREASSEIYRQISGVVTDDITNIVAFKSAGMEQSAQDHLRTLREQETDAFQKRRSSAVLLDFPRNVATVTLIFVAFWMVLESAQPGPDAVALLVLTMTYMFQIFRNVSDVPDLMYRYDDLVSKLEPTMDVLTDNYETIRDPKPASKKTITKGAIEFRNLHFAYNDDTVSSKKVFADLNLSIKSGERVGIVGISGAGKSTLASLLMRFDEITGGSILVDGTDIRDIQQSYLRQKIAYVPQEPVLFHRSIHDNIAYHNPDATLRDIQRAAKAAHAHEFIQNMPAAYDTIVGERGVKLSGGQKQRIVIARAVLKQAPIVLFDEATSALDSESEQIIQQALPEIIGGQTAIIIAHRLSTIAGLDRIIVMHDGMIEEQGTHEQLLTKNGRYKRLWLAQTKGRRDI